MVLLLGLPACEAGPFSFGPECEETEMEARPVDAARVEDVVLEARLTSGGEPVGDAAIDFVWYSTPKGDDTDFVDSTRLRTGSDGIARLSVVPHLNLESARDRARRTQSYRAVYTSLLSDYCGASDLAPFRVNEP